MMPKKSPNCRSVTVSCFRKIGQEYVWDELIFPGMSESVYAVLQAAKGSSSLYRDKTFQLFGADFLITENFIPYLIEINSIPGLNLSTSVIANLAPMLLSDIVKVVRYHSGCVVGSTVYLYLSVRPLTPMVAVYKVEDRLCWYILGKHSNCIFTNNTNTECGIETSLLNEDECLTSQIVHNSEIITESYNVIELGEETSLVCKENVDLLKQFEMNVDSGISFNQIEFQAAKYVTGYVANKYFSKYPQLIDPNGDGSPWIEHVSRGGLKIPSVTLNETVETIEKEFKKLHEDNLSKITGVMKYLTDILWSKVNSQNIPKEVLQCLVRTRTFIQLDNLNS
ncbi:hypothetical protein ACI65C_004141 [Semiaphis heraclei]